MIKNSSAPGVSDPDFRSPKGAAEYRPVDSAGKQSSDAAH
jgi:hypothetical protein